MSSSYVLGWGLLSSVLSIFCRGFEGAKSGDCSEFRCCCWIVPGHLQMPQYSSSGEAMRMPPYFSTSCLLGYSFSSSSVNTQPSSFFSSSTGDVFLEINRNFLFPCLILHNGSLFTLQLMPNFFLDLPVLANLLLSGHLCSRYNKRSDDLKSHKAS